MFHITKATSKPDLRVILENVTEKYRGKRAQLTAEGKVWEGVARKTFHWLHYFGAQICDSLKNNKTFTFDLIQCRYY